MNNEWFYIRQWEIQREERKKMKELQWFKEYIKFNHNSTLIEAVVYYCSKDYRIKVLNPIETELPGRHLPYAMPARYVMNESNSIPNVKNICILESCKEQIIESLKEKENEIN